MAYADTYARLMGVRIHTKDSKALLDYLGRNERTFQIEKTSTGFPTYNYAGKSVYVRDKPIHRGALNKIMSFHNQVSKSDLYKFVSDFTVKQIKEESSELERTLVYKGFMFNPTVEKSFQKVIKIDFNTAYWQTCRYFKMISYDMFKDVSTGCTKTTRLRITGTLGKKTILTDYVKGKKTKAYVKEEKKKRIVFQNIYNRIRKFVDELMIWCYRKNPANFIGYYVDCVWLREYDTELIEKLNKIFKLKTDVVDLEVIKNDHSKIIVCEESEEELDVKIYDAQFKSNEFVIYKNLYNFTPDLMGINLKVK
jgi:regulator of RNase E activity RraB